MSRSIAHRIRNLGCFHAGDYYVEPLFWFPRGRYQKRLAWQKEFGSKRQRR